MPGREGALWRHVDNVRRLQDAPCSGPVRTGHRRQMQSARACSSSGRALKRAIKDQEPGCFVFYVAAGAVVAVTVAVDVPSAADAAVDRQHSPPVCGL